MVPQSSQRAKVTRLDLLLFAIHFANLKFSHLINLQPSSHKITRQRSLCNADSVGVSANRP
ncbi:hypothetical protein NSND_50138 [Nitrospira sp. ND1]|nr:hypothetical protein NSND_50138 [Nitrospira sp. ND1]